jgi:hypothetical protein
VQGVDGVNDLVAGHHSHDALADHDEFWVRNRVTPPRSRDYLERSEPILHSFAYVFQIHG